MRPYPGSSLVLNRNHPLNSGRQCLLLTTPYTSGGVRFVDLMGRHHGLNQNMTTAQTGWKPTARKGGYGEVVYDFTNSTKTTIPTNPVFDSSFGTWGMWVRYISTSEGQCFLARQTPDVGPSIYRRSGFALYNRITAVTTEMTVIIMDAAGQVALYNQFTAGQTNLVDGTWKHVLLTYSMASGGPVYVCINGVVVGSFTNNVAWSFNSQEIRVGYASYNDGTYKDYGGALDGVTYWNRMLTLPELQEEYIEAKSGYQGVLARRNPVSYSFPAPADVPVAYVPTATPSRSSRSRAVTINRSNPLNSGRQCLLLTTPHTSGGGRWTDLFGRHHGVHTGMDTTAVGWKPTNRPGGYGHVAYDAAVGTHTIIPSNPTFDSLKGTWGIWLRSKNPAVAGQQFLNRIDNDLKSGFDLYSRSTAPITELNFFAANAAGTILLQKLYTAGQTNLLDGNWKHLVFAYGTENTVTCTCYINGLSVTGATNSGTWAYNNQDVKIGWGAYHDATATDWIGDIDAPTFWNRKLSAYDVYTEYMESRTGYRNVFSFPSPVTYSFGAPQPAPVVTPAPTIARTRRPGVLVPNRNHPLNQGRQCLLLTTPYTSGGNRWTDIMGRYDGVHTTMGTSAVGWKPTTRPGGYGHIAYDRTVAGNSSIPGHAIFGSTLGTWGFWIRYKDLSLKGQQFFATTTLDFVTARKAGIVMLNAASVTTTQLRVLVTDADGIATGGSLADARANMQDGLWKHIVVTYTMESNGTCDVYINGVLIESLATNAWSYGGADVQIGYCTYGDTNYKNLNGEMDGVTFWNRRLSAAEIWEEYSSSKSGYNGVLVTKSPPACSWAEAVFPPAPVVAGPTRLLGRLRRRAGGSWSCR